MQQKSKRNYSVQTRSIMTESIECHRYIKALQVLVHIHAMQKTSSRNICYTKLCHFCKHSVVLRYFPVSKVGWPLLWVIAMLGHCRWMLWSGVDSILHWITGTKQTGKFWFKRILHCWIPPTQCHSVCAFTQNSILCMSGSHETVILIANKNVIFFSNTIGCY